MKRTDVDALIQILTNLFPQAITLIENRAYFEGLTDRNCRCCRTCKHHHNGNGPCKEGVERVGPLDFCDYFEFKED